MSSGPQIESGGSGGSDDIQVTQEDGTLSINFGGPLAALYEHGPTVWVLMALTGMSAEMIGRLLLQGKSPAAIIVDDYLFQTVLLPIGRDLYFSSLQIVNGAIIIAFGSDRQVGVTPGSQPGIADIPLAIFTPLIVGMYRTGAAVYLAIRGLNEGIAQGLPALGVGAPVLVNVLLAVEITVLGYVIWVLLSFIPFVNVITTITALTSLASRAMRRLL